MDDEIANDIRNNKKRKTALSKETDADKIEVEINDEEILNDKILNDTFNHNERN